MVYPLLGVSDGITAVRALVEGKVCAVVGPSVVL